MSKKDDKDNNRARIYHKKGWKLRENDEHAEALKNLDHAIVLYQKEKDYKGIFNALKDKVLVWKHLFLLTNDRIFAILARKDAESMLSIGKAKKLDNILHSAYFRLGEIAMIVKNWKEAMDKYSTALKIYKGPLSERGDYRYHLGEAIYRSGEKDRGKRAILKGLEEIKKGADEIDPFLIHVWESGVYLRLADLLKDDNPKEAKKYFEKGKKIAQKDEKLVIRRRQFKQLKQNFE